MMATIQLKDILIDDSPERYLPSDALVKALETAYALKRPLLLSGEPGTGKTDFAKWVAAELAERGFSPAPLVYNTKSSSTAQDLFYFYDAVSHFRESRSQQEWDIVSSDTTAVLQSDDDEPLVRDTNSVRRVQRHTISQKETSDFIELKALGLAFARAKGLSGAAEHLDFFKAKGVEADPLGTVVLIDEVDKAPRDFPNDLLNEIESYEFEIREINRRIKVEKKERGQLVVILTSNFEKNLPEAFLRRCVYFHIEFPKEDVLAKIVMARLNLDQGQLAAVEARVADFVKLRGNDLQKKPSTSELIDWTRVINNEGLLDKALFDANGKVDRASPLLPFMPVLLKKKEDLELFAAR